MSLSLDCWMAMTAGCSAEHCLQDILGTATKHLLLSTFHFIFFNISLTSFVNLSHFQFIWIIFLFPCVGCWRVVYLFLSNSCFHLISEEQQMHYASSYIHPSLKHCQKNPCYQTTPNTGFIKISVLWQVKWYLLSVLSGHYCINIYTSGIPTDLGKY